MTLIANRPSNGVVPATVVAGNDDPVRTSAARPGLEGSPILADSNAQALSEALMREVDDRRLLASIEFESRYQGDLGAAVRLARASFERYDPRRHKLSHLGGDERQPGEVSYSSFFRAVAPAEFRGCRNVWAAAQVFDRMLAEAGS